MQKVKKLPQRQCVGCRERKEKRELIRVVRSPEGGISLDFKGKKPGRGAYLCPDLECLKRARKSRALERALLGFFLGAVFFVAAAAVETCLLYTSPSPRD